MRGQGGSRGGGGPFRKNFGQENRYGNNNDQGGGYNQGFQKKFNNNGSYVKNNQFQQLS